MKTLSAALGIRIPIPLFRRSVSVTISRSLSHSIRKSVFFSFTENRVEYELRCLPDAPVRGKKRKSQSFKHYPNSKMSANLTFGLWKLFLLPKHSAPHPTPFFSRFFSAQIFFALCGIYITKDSIEFPSDLKFSVSGM